MHKRPPGGLAMILGLVLSSACVGARMDTDTDSDSSNPSDSGDSEGTTGTTTTDPTGSTGSSSGGISSTGSTGTTTESTDSEGTTETTGGVPTICDRLGGDEGLTELHSGFFAKVLLDERINGYFLNTDVDGEKFIGCLNSQVSAEMECKGAIYTCKAMVIAHQNMGISSIDFADFVEDYGSALDDHQKLYPDLSDDDTSQIMGALAEMEEVIVEDVGNGKTVYQRVGRKPGLKAMVGDPDTIDTFVSTIAADEAINGFFADADFVRFATCFTRQLGAIDGPVKYTEEVDSPGAGVDEGVSAANPCGQMLAVHQGLTNSDDMAAIMYVDFVALVADLVAAMESAGFAESDQQTILSVLGPMCELIVGDSPNDCPGNNQSLTYDASGVNLVIVDDNYDGTKGSMACASFNVVGNGIDVVGGIEVKVGIDHAWVGDLVIKVFSPDGSVITVLSRPGLAEAADDGKGVSVEGSDLSAAAPISFLMGAENDAEKMGTMLGIDEVICQVDGLCEYFPNAGKALPGDLGDLAGEAAPGTWQVCVGDAGSADEGMLVDAKLKVHRVKF
ncbi:MAG TPA: hypothetical protein ENJ18_13150 [Nannocystis exedens]|nr:hypothetical protein [Nannocystis exedens]